jgi:hypothetical protein
MAGLVGPSRGRREKGDGDDQGRAEKCFHAKTVQAQSAERNNEAG